MRSYIFRRLLKTIPLVFAIATVTFFIVRLAPGDPFAQQLEQMAMRGLDPSGIELMREKLGLNDSLFVQYISWLKDIATGDFGTSIRYGVPVSQLFAEAIPFTLILTSLAMLLDALIGIPLGIFAALKSGTTTERYITLISLVLYSVPGFLIAILLISFFSVSLGWLPPSQAVSFDYYDLSIWGRFVDRAQHLILPVTVLGVFSAAGTARYVRNRLLDALSQDFVLAAKARGHSNKTVVMGHALRTALLPLITNYGMSLPYLLGGAAIIETIFAWPGMGKLAVDAVSMRDYPLIMAVTSMGAVLTILGTLLADIFYAIADPRVRYD